MLKEISTSLKQKQLALNESDKVDAKFQHSIRPVPAKTVSELETLVKHTDIVSYVIIGIV